MRPTPVIVRTQATQRLAATSSLRFEGEKNEAPTASASPKKKGQFAKRFMLASTMGLTAGLNLKTLLCGAGVGTLIAGAAALSPAFGFIPVIIPAGIGLFSLLGGLTGFMAGWQLDPDRIAEEAQKGREHLREYINEQLSNKSQVPSIRISW
jgi:hypothetical protein